MQYNLDQSTINNINHFFTGPLAFFWFIWALLIIVGMWKTYVKAGEPGWAVLIPIYNLYIWLKIIDRSAWWLLFFLIPIVNIIVSLIISIDLAKVFGKSGFFGFFFMWLFSPIGFLILGLGRAKFVGTAKN